MACAFTSRPILTEFPELATQYEGDRQAVEELMKGLQDRIRGLEKEIREERVQKLTEAGEYESRLVRLAELLEEQRKRCKEITEVADRYIGKIQELTQAKEVAVEEKEKAEQEIASLQVQLSQKEEQICELKGQFQGALERCAHLQEEMIEMVKAHAKQLDENNRMLAATANALKGRVTMAQKNQNLGDFVSTIVNGLINLVLCKPAS